MLPLLSCLWCQPLWDVRLVCAHTMLPLFVLLVVPALLVMLSFLPWALHLGRALPSHSSMGL